MDAYKGATGDTMTDGDNHIFVFLTTSSGRVAVPINEIIPTGSSFGLKVKPQTSNTSQAFYVAVVGFLRSSSV